MQKLVLSLLLFLTASPKILHAQDTLPKFIIKNVGAGRIIVGWTNTFENIRQITIQRSFDSLAGFKSIMTVPDPTTPQNGYMDTKASNDHMFYRLFILLEKGVYLFSDVKKPVIDTVLKADYANRIDRIGRLDSAGLNLSNSNRNKPEIFMPSLHVFTSKDGDIRVNLPEQSAKAENKDEKKYSIKFFEENDIFLFELKNIKEKTFKIDKTAFYHAGWFRFELYEDGKLIEKHKFYLDREF